jgi:alpha-aminoadipate carrier protein LysW
VVKDSCQKFRLCIYMKCPDCSATVETLQELVLHELLQCPCCGLELEVVQLTPVKLQELQLEGEDWGE